jgi:hypothetical protein
MTTACDAPAVDATEVPETPWAVANQRHLLAALARVRVAVAAHAAACGATGPRARPVNQASADGASVEGDPPALERVVRGFGLSPFERDLLLLCAGCELDASFATLCAAAHRDERRPFATFGLALAVLPGPHWSALAPDRALRRWRLVEVASDDHLTSSRLRIDERVLHFLAGVTTAPSALRSLLTPVAPPDQLTPSHLERARQLVAVWQGGPSTGELPAVHLATQDLPSAAAVAAAAAAGVDLRLHLVRAADLATGADEREDLARRLEREAVLGRLAVLIDLEPGAPPDVRHAAMDLLDRTRGPVAIATAEPVRLRDRGLVRLDLAAPDAAERRRLWQDALGDLADAAREDIEVVSTHFELGPVGIRVAGADARRQAANGTGLGTVLWDACRRQTRPGLQGLATRIDARAGWDDLVLPVPQLHTLRTLVAHVRQRARVYEQWGFAGRSDRGLGIGALFTGASGTGKTMAAEVLANELRLDLYRIDLSAVVSKYVGETEKHLRQVFDAAEAGGALLLFDEADALFGRRSEVRDSHDRYANIEVGYLLQRVETYRGLVLLTTNQPQALDGAFARRIRFTVQFPFPDATQRAEIWRRVFPPATPTESLRVEKLARLNLTGGHIRNLALNAAFLAADAREPVRMKHLLAAAHAEFAKLDRPLNPAETAGWM